MIHTNERHGRMAAEANFVITSSAAIASILSLYYRVQLQEHLNDPTWNVGYVLLWASVVLHHTDSVKELMAAQTS